jgi:hypothetical protein
MSTTTLNQEPTTQQLVALTAVAAMQPQNIRNAARALGIKELSQVDALRVQAAADRTKAIVAQPGYQEQSLQAVSMGGVDLVGLNVVNALKKVATAPLALAAIPAAGLAWGARKAGLGPLAKGLTLASKPLTWAAEKGTWTIPGSSTKPSTPSFPGVPGALPGMPGVPGMPTVNPQLDARLQAALQSARMRRLAAAQRVQAAEMQSSASQREMQAVADAANAEADALEAEAQARADAEDAADAAMDLPPTDTSGAWLQRAGSARPTLVVGELVVGYDNLGRVQIF